jgi:hypothetical protein
VIVEISCVILMFVVIFCKNTRKTSFRLMLSVIILENVMRNKQD